jgi:CheY-like chemotaxis protein
LPSFDGDVDIEEQIKQDLIVEMGTEKILMIEDDKKVALMQTQMLEKLGYQVTCHLDCFMALDEFIKAPAGFDLIVTDMTMPGMNGYQLAEEIYKINPEMPVILCTGYDEKIDDVKIAKHGIVDLLNKPVAVKNFSSSLRRALDTRQDARVPILQ